MLFLQKISAVKCSPSFILEIKAQRAAIGESAMFTCQFSGYPKPGNVADPLSKNIFKKKESSIVFVTY